ncbi:hypothetical protein BE20_00855 [Sorangium cellulosum]|uniref:FHA domain-containing protein n=1 Tax=Sorangium cellulosum TaxID=56 RepID=A0A150RMC6_SORCE|nr:hypothetical protein BE18_18595 [Sorangium cellulosum]KYF94238.1 hypothetical protein BE20_00855 [Sorangium cellulosum]
MNGRKVHIDVGASLHVGRTELSNLVVPHDKHLSGRHFSLAWDGGRATLRDLESQGGTLLDGERVISGEVVHGSWIRAGETDFSVYVEDKVQAPEDKDPEDDELLGDPERALKSDERAEEARRRHAARAALLRLRNGAEREPLFAILDAARSDRILELLRQSIEPHQSLYEGIQGEPLAPVAPYLTGPFRSDSVLLDRLVMEGWGRRWGIFVTSREPFREVRRHFRRFLLVENEETGEPLYFRFYDPWVMTTFWSVSTPRQASYLLAPLGALLAEGEGGSLLRMHVGAIGGSVVAPW